MFGVTGPNPLPYITMVSPGLAGREASPAIAPCGRTYVLPGRNATTYCLPPSLNDAGASNPGSVAFTVTLNGMLGPFLFSTVICCAPVGILDGSSTFT